MTTGSPRRAPAGGATSKARVLIGAVGVVSVIVGVAGMWREVTLPAELLPWLAGAVVAHDGVLVPLELLLGAVVWRASAVLPRRVRQVVMGGLMVAGMLTLLGVPLALRRNVYPNPTVNHQDYAANLGWLLLATAVVTMLTAVVTARYDRAASKR
ncbi:hypothetical protein LX16_4554 [Stackebrandtia albiflava]|uniref:Uncharacterized protein n=1 Tax=Stackebrandtia albiflava TaxID=406432 RepID=A0A562URU8_9ACTN|nr:hypothetical protein [Stackebrandtia albiflava]TWJ08327.1 hypothetical protein LX16_4554 [Stackebrandtia albiflava]